MIFPIQNTGVMTVITVIKQSIKDFIKEVKDTFEWIMAGCPKPVRIPIKPKGGHNDSRSRKK